MSDLPAYTRLPKAGKLCPISGLSRSAMSRLVLGTADNNFSPPVVSKKVPGGGRVIDVESLLEFLDNLPADLAHAQKERVRRSENTETK